MRISVVFLILCWASAMDGQPQSYRLPNAIKPNYYTLEILTHLGDEGHFNFYGDVWIQVKCLEKTKAITLHSKNLDINQKTVHIHDTSDPKKTNLTISAFDQDKPNDFFTLRLQDDLQPEHTYEVFLSYSGTLQEGLAGYYKSTYTDKRTNETRYTAVTQFEPADARRAFPCFDEPAMKATFKISLGRLEKYSSISNMPIVKTEPIDGKKGWVWDRYAQSVPMSTYLVAFIVSDYGYKESMHMKNNVTFRTWARKDALDQVEFASEVGPKALLYYEDFFGINYPLPKQDMVALPDFSAGAMENWGLITYRESYLLYDTKVSSSTSQDGVVSVIAHELAHQWFGNLVTMKWWTDLWLNEGFATYMATLAEDYLYPQWNSLRDGVVNNMLNVFSFDSLKSSHPVSVPIGHPDEIQEIFDTISYKKGSSLLRMMALFLGEQTLRKGVSNYLKKYQYSNAEQDDLWDSLTEQAHKDDTLAKNVSVKTVMDSWTLQTGYPVIFVQRNYDGRSAEVTQKRYLRDTEDKSNTQKWWIPLSYTTQEKQDFNTTKPAQWLSPDEKSAQVTDLSDKDHWVIFNVQMAGIYKVNYDQTNWDLIIKALNSDKYTDIPVLNRVLLIDDAADLAWVGQISYKVMMDLFNYLQREKEYLPWKAALNNINTLNQMLKRSPDYGTFKLYMRALLEPIYNTLGGVKLQKATEGKLDTVKHQVLIVSWACRFDVGNCLSDAKELFKKFQENPENADVIPRDLRQTLYCNAIRHGGEKEWDFLWKQYQTSNVATLKKTIMNALGCTRETWLLRRYLEWSLNGTSGIRKQDAAYVFGTVAAADVGYFVAKEFFYDNLDRIAKYISPGISRLTRYLSSLASKIVTVYEYEEFKNFVGKNNETFSKIKQGTDQALERAELNVQWQKNHLKSLSELLSEQLTECKKQQ